MDPEIVQDVNESPLVIDHGERVSEITAPDDGVSELEKHKQDRGYTKPQKAEPEPPPIPEAAAPEKVEEKKKDERWKDPDTGDVYDMRHKVARRIKTLLEERGKTNSRADALEKRVNELTQLLIERGATPKQAEKEAKAVVNADAEPDSGDTTKYPEGQFDKAFIRDYSRWAARQETQQFSEATRTERSLERQQAAEAHRTRQWQETLPEARKKYPDFDDALGRIPNTPEHAPIVRLMMGSPVGNDVAYVLGTSPDALEAFQRAPSDEHRLRLLYHLEAQIIARQRGEDRPAPAMTRAPQPTTPVHTGAGAAAGEDWSRTDDPDQYARWRQRRQSRR